MIMWVLSQELKVELTYEKSTKLTHHFNSIKKEKPQNDLKRWRKVLDKIQHLLLMNLRKPGQDTKLPELNKVNL